jgi:hypothetical protein
VCAGAPPFEPGQIDGRLLEQVKIVVVAQPDVTAEVDRGQP